MPHLLFGEGFSGSGSEDMGGGGHGMGYLMGGAEKKTPINRGAVKNCKGK